MTRREDFPVATFQHLEARLHELRVRIMERAAQMAKEQDLDSDVYRVQPSHINAAMREMGL